MSTRTVTFTGPVADPNQCKGLQVTIRILDSDGTAKVRMECKMDGDPNPPSAKEGPDIPGAIRTAIRTLIQAILDDQANMLGT